MPIDPRTIVSGDNAWVIAYQLQDHNRRIGDLEAVRTLIGVDAITGANIAPNSITTNEIAANTITAADIASNTITAGQIAANTITAGQIAANTITATQIAAGTITATQIAAATITTGNIAAGTILASNIAAGAITASLIAANAVTANAIQAGAVTAGKIAADAITTNEIAANTITAGDIAAATITSATIATGTITSTNIAANAITATQLATDAVTSAKIISGAVTSTKISVSTLSAVSADMGSITAGTITGGKIRTSASGARVELGLGIVTTSGTFDGIAGVDATGAITFKIDAATGAATFAGTIASGASGLGNISGALNPATQITDGTVPGSKIIADTITATEIAGATITGVEIAANTITAGKLSVGTLSAITADMGSITAGTITGATFQTAAANPRVVLNSTGLNAYNAGGVNTFSLSSAGALTISAGTITAADINPNSLNLLVGSAAATQQSSIRWYDTIGGVQSGSDAMFRTAGPGNINWRKASVWPYAGTNKAFFYVGSYAAAGADNSGDISANYALLQARYDGSSSPLTSLVALAQSAAGGNQAMKIVAADGSSDFVRTDGVRVLVNQGVLALPGSYSWFTQLGGTFLFCASATCYTTSASVTAQIGVGCDGYSVQMTKYFNNASSHETLNMACWTQTIAAGSHTINVRSDAWAVTDPGFDFLTVWAIRIS